PANPESARDVLLQAVSHPDPLLVVGNACTPFMEAFREEVEVWAESTVTPAQEVTPLPWTRPGQRPPIATQARWHTLT
ncbi:MAG: hypothetical protein R3185_09645, partial [Candidatus Thermoplasmatota archaeon]|nr:hypothetical protein [Candidatus Thermoplasmatota archaeon]